MNKNYALHFATVRRLRRRVKNLLLSGENGGVGARRGVYTTQQFNLKQILSGSPCANWNKWIKIIYDLRVINLVLINLTSSARPRRADSDV